MVQSNFKQICLQPSKYYSWREISEMGYFFQQYGVDYGVYWVLSL